MSSKINKVTEHPYFYIEVLKPKPDSSYDFLQVWSREKVLRELSHNEDCFNIVTGLPTNRPPSVMEGLNEERRMDDVLLPFEGMDWNGLT